MISTATGTISGARNQKKKQHEISTNNNHDKSRLVRSSLRAVEIAIRAVDSI
jgi:hypothetical protein